MTDLNRDSPSEIVESPLDEEVIRRIYHSINDGVFLHDAATGEIVDANETASEMYGYSREELRDLAIADLTADAQPDTQETAVERVQRAAEGDPQVFEWRANDSEGEDFWVEVSMRRAAVGEACIVIVIVRDVTERKEQERKLAESEARYRSLTEDVLDTSNVATIILDAEFEVAWVNRATEEYFGADRSALIGTDKREAIDAWIADIFEEPDHFAETVLATYDDNTYVENFECHVPGDADREERWLEHWSRPIETGLYEGGRIEHYQDITRIKRSQRALERTNEQLRVLNRIVRHDIRNDMNVAMGWSQELAPHVDAEGEAILDRIEATNRHVVDLTKTVRSFAAITETDGDPDLQPTDLRAILTEELDRRRSTYPDAAFVVDGEIPAVEVTANELLSSVFRNVLNNAVQHNDTDRPRVEVSVAEAADAVTVRIADDGPGVPDDRKDAVFGRGESDIDDPAAGIGLYLVDTLVSGYGGEVWIEDAEPRGAAFVIELPTADG